MSTRAIAAMLIVLAITAGAGCAPRGPLPDRNAVGSTLDAATGRADLARVSAAVRARLGA